MSSVRVLVGDLFTSQAQTLTNTVNTVGVMGKGIALQFRKRFPEMFDDYVVRCEAGEVKLGQPYLYRSLLPPFVLNFPTKEHWRSLSRLDAITDGLEYLQAHHQQWGIESLAVPPLGCGEGGLEWRIVGPTLYRGLARLDIPVELYAPFGTPHDELQVDFLEGGHAPAAPETRVSASAVALATILDRIAAQNHHYPIGRVAMQKIAYFATQAGIPTGLEFQRRPYGPFAEGLKRLLSRLINNGLVDETRRGRMIVASPGPTLHDAQALYGDQLDAWAPQIERVADLFLRLPSSRKAEIAASVHYSAMGLANKRRHEGTEPVDEGELVHAVTKWKERRDPPATEDEILVAARTLAFLDWIHVTSTDTSDIDVPA